jgi:hypothetical protein
VYSKVLKNAALTSDNPKLEGAVELAIIDSGASNLNDLFWRSLFGSGFSDIKNLLDVCLSHDLQIEALASCQDVSLLYIMHKVL